MTSGVIGAIAVNRILSNNPDLFESNSSYFNKIFLDIEMSGYNRCECGSILNYYNIENPLYINESITNNNEKIEIKDEELISKLQLNFLETKKCKKLLSYIRKSSNKENISYAYCTSCNQIYSKIVRRIKQFCGIKYSDIIIYEKFE